MARNNGESGNVESGNGEAHASTGKLDHRATAMEAELSALRSRVAELEGQIAGQGTLGRELRETERALDTLISNLPGLVYRCINDRDWTMEFLSEACEQVTGYPAETIQAKQPPWNDLIDPDHRESIWENVQSAVHERRPFTVTYRIKRRDGRWRWVWEQGRGVFNDAGELLCLEGFITDIDDAKRAREDLEVAHEELARRQQELQSVLEHASVVLFAINPEGIITVSEGEGLKALDLKPGEVVGQSVFDLYADHPGIVADLHRALRGEAFQTAAAVGDLTFVTGYRPMIGPDDEVMGTIGVATDVTARAAAEAALREAHDDLEQRVEQRTEELRVSEAKIKHLTDAIPGCVYQYCIAPDGREWFELISRGALDIFGKPAEELLEDVNAAWSAIHPADIPGLRASVDRIIRTHEPWQYEFRVAKLGSDSDYSGDGKGHGEKPGDGLHDEVTWVRGRSTLQSIREDGTLLYNGIFVDITEQKRSEAERQELDILFKQIAENIQEVFWVWDVERRQPRYVSPAFEKVWGRPRSVFDTNSYAWLEGIHPEDRERVGEAFQRDVARGRYAQVYRVRQPNGNIRWIRDRGFGVGDSEDGEVTWVTGMAEDITELKEAEEAARLHQAELAHASRLATMGELATGFAHEVNQPLGVIINYAEAWVRHTPRDERDPDQLSDHVEDGRETAEKIIHQAERAAQVIKRIRQFVMRGEMRPEPVDVNRLVHHALDLAQSHLHEHDIELDLDLSNLPAVKADRIQIEQVALNLVLNAIDAMAGAEADASDTAPPGPPTQGARRLLISSRPRKPGFVQVSFADTGPGVDDASLDTIFEPFYTSKEHGMGMGLSISRSIIEGHGGRLTAENQPGGGALFTFTLPL